MGTPQRVMTESLFSFSGNAVSKMYGNLVWTETWSQLRSADSGVGNIHGAL